MEAPTKLEFDVQMTCGNCVKAIEKAFNGVEGIKTLNIDLGKGKVLVETQLPTEKVKSIIESSGRRAVLKGMGGTGQAHLGAAVSIMEVGNSAVKGLVRLVQTDENKLVVDGTIDGLLPGKHALCIHEFGDISQGCDSCGNVLSLKSEEKQILGDIGDIEAGPDGRSEFRIVNDRLKVWDMIGRSMMIHSCTSDRAHKENDLNNRLSCGIIARSAGLFQNVKQICACDGVTQWDERDKPLAGKGRQSNL